MRKTARPTGTVDSSVPLRADAIVQAELGEAPPELFGIALSGGGIRSATFNLGLLQGLARTPLLKQAHYLSTVSGGGYVGGFWTAWRHHQATDTARKHAAHDADADSRPSVGSPDDAFPTARGGFEHPAIRHLRRFSNFLSPRLGVFSYDTGRMLVGALTATIPTVLATIALLVLILMAWASLAATLFTYTWAWTIVLPLVAAACLVGVERTWCGRECAREQPAYYFFAAIAIVFMTALWQAMLLVPGLLTARPHWTLLAPAFAVGVTFVALTLGRAATSRFTNSFARVRRRGALDRVLSRLLLMTAVWVTISAVWLLSYAAYGFLVTVDAAGVLYSAAVAAFTSAFVWSRKIGVAEPNKPFGSALAAQLRPRLPQLLGYLVVVLVVAGVAMGLMAAGSGGSIAGMRDTLRSMWHPLIAAAAAVVTLATAFFFHPNRIGLHSFYRGRIARAYLGASNMSTAPAVSAVPAAERRPFTEEAEGDDMRLSELRFGTRARPFHLICCAVNDLTPPEALSNMQRGAASAVLSPYGFGVSATDATGADGTGLYLAPWPDHHAPTLGAAITASGAAFNSMMGAFSRRLGPAATFVLAMLNLRLGLWLQHPRYMAATQQADPVPTNGGTPAAPQGARSKRGSPNEWIMPGLRFYQELFGMSSAQSHDIHLSDGGHFENTGVYELIRRECRYIIASDCGADPDRAFDDVGNLIRRVRQDFGAEIRIDLSPLRLDEDGCAVQPMVAGDIHYASGQVGVLLLFKPTLMGNEPPDVTQYRTRNSVFPNESTGDQFYDEAQWESYRRLGEHAADAAFAFLDKSLEHATDADPQIGRIFARARFEWLPRPRGFEERVARFAERAAALEAELAQVRVSSPLGLAAVNETDGGAVVELNLLDNVRAPSREQPIDMLGAIRSGLLFMEETYYAWDLENTHDRPFCLGVMNYFGRWMNMPLLRSCWAVFKPLHSAPFTRFMERNFGLPPLRDGHGQRIARLADPAGFASRSFALLPRDRRTARGIPMTDLPARIAYRLELGGTLPPVEAALIEGGEQPGLIYWDAEDFFVPPGLWGAGIGEDFLHKLGTDASMQGLQQWVSIARPDPGDSAAASRAADRRRMYAAAGFRSADPPESLRTGELEAGGAGARSHRGHADWLMRDAAAPI